MPIDLFCILALGFGFWQGYQRGIIQVIFNTAAYIFGVTLAFKMTPTTTDILEKAFNSTNPLMFLAGFLINLAILMIVVRYAAKGMEGLFEAAYMGTINQLFGGIVYGAFSILLFSILLWFSDKAMLVGEDVKSASRTYPYLQPLPAQARTLAVRFQPVFSEVWNTSITWMDKMKNYAPKATEKKTKYYDIEEDDKSKSATSGGIEDFPEEARPRQKVAPPVDEGNGIEEE